MNILITGKTGFIGKNLVEAYKNSYNVFAPSHKELDLLIMENIGRYLSENKIDIVIHCANWNNTKQAASDFDVLSGNLRMFYNLVKYQDLYKKMLYFGSGAEYSKNRALENISETDFGNIIPTDAYGLSKYVMAREALCSSKVYDLCLFGIYGKYEEWHRRFISNAICRSLYNLPITMEQNVKFDYLYITDLIKIVNWFIENTPQFHRYNITTGCSVSLLELAEIIKAQFLGKPDIIIKKDGWKESYSGCNTRMINELKYFSFSDIRENVAQMISYYKTQKHKINPEKLL